MKAYTVNNHLVGVGNDQILGTDQGGGATYTAGDGIDITNDVISVDDTVALASALPTTELGKFTIKNNVSGGPIEVIVPIDQGHAVYNVLMDSDSVSGTYEPGSGYKCVLFKSPGYDNDYWNYTGGTVTLHVPEAVTGIANLYACYASNSNPTSSYGTGPNLFNGDHWYIPDQSTYILQPGDYEIATVANQVPESAGGYGKYISIAANGPSPDINALSKISFKGMERHPELGYDVNLDRYYLGNTSTITSTGGYTQATIYTDPTSKKQSVYLPYSMPSSWSSNLAQSFEYGTNYNSPSNYSYSTKQYRAYKTTSSPTRYQFAYCTDWDYTNRIMTFVAYDNSGNAIEKWTLDYSTYSSNVWTTTPISTGGSSYTAGNGIDITNNVISVDDTVYIPYSASGVSLPNSKFEIDTNGQAYKVITEGGTSTNTVTYTTDDQYIDYSQIIVEGNEFNVHTGDTITVNNFHNSCTSVRFHFYATSVQWDITATVTNNTATIISDRDYVYNGCTLFLEPTGVVLSTGNETLSITHTEVTPPVVEEYITDGDLSIYALASAIPTVPSAGNMLSVTNDTIDVTTTAGITDVQLVNALPASPVSSVLYLIPET